VRPSDRESTINKLLMKFKIADKYLYEKNKGPEALIENIEKQQELERATTELGPKSVEISKKKVFREGTIKQKMEKLIKIVTLEEQKVL